MVEVVCGFKDDNGKFYSNRFEAELANYVALLRKQLIGEANLEVRFSALLTILEVMFMHPEFIQQMLDLKKS